ncbi:hypothetical protein AB4114_30320 [Paenibacillus sp. 2RAB27]|uniref:hypothetical protein n=1 Tax=Paenibacillus sp. 2RAB27 TaxID=3232991 RepID=UPI003F9521E1
MIIITIVFLGIFMFEWNFLKHLGRKKRTFWITGCSIFVAYVYVMAVYSFQNLPSPNQLIKYVFSLYEL